MACLSLRGINLAYMNYEKGPEHHKLVDDNNGCGE